MQRTRVVYPEQDQIHIDVTQTKKKDIHKVMVIQPTLLIAANVWCIIIIARVYHK